jgi:hypothetical protein
MMAGFGGCMYFGLEVIQILSLSSTAAAIEFPSMIVPCTDTLFIKLIIDIYL